jgi:hypothetical protein
VVLRQQKSSLRRDLKWNPKEPIFFVELAYATRRAESIGKALGILLHAVDLHPNDGAIQFNLACYEAQMGGLDRAKAHLKRATEIDAKFKLKTCSRRQTARLKENVHMYDSIQLTKTASSRRASQVTWPNDNKAVGNCLHALIAGLRPAASILARRIAFPLIFLTAGLALVHPCAGQSGTWTATGGLTTARYTHTATLLPSGMVLVAGGYNFGYLASAELYDPASGSWTTTGSLNTAFGLDALASNTTASDNTAIGYEALFFSTGSNNIALGASAGSKLTTGSNNIDIAGLGVAGESNTMRLGKKGVQKNTFIAGISGVTVAGGVGVIVDTNGHLGTIVSSARFKDEIKPMAKASEAILALQPVTFRYKHELDPDGIPQFGLVAEQVEKVNSDLVAHDAQGKPYTVRYEAVNAMLLNEFLKEHRKVEKQAGINQRQEVTIARLEAALKAQAAQIQKVSDQLKTQAVAPRVVANN